MEFNEANEKVFTEYVEAQLEGTLTEEQKNKLEEFLKVKEFRKLYIHMVHQETVLKKIYNGRELQLPERKSKTPIIFSLVAIAACITLVFILTGKSVQPKTEYLAFVKEDHQCNWNVELQNQKLPSGKDITLTTGLAKLDFPDGSSAVFEAPISFKIINNSKIFLNKGSIFVHGKPGFTVDTKQTSVIDLGTKFGVSSDEDVLIQVYEGSVKSEEITYVKGDAVLVSENKKVTQLAFQEDRFLQEMPTPPKVGKNKIEYGWPYSIPYNVPTHTSMEVHPAKGIVIDGDLSDWDNKGIMTSRCRAPFDNTYFVKGQMKYDDKGLYIAANVGDLNPMMNRMSPYDPEEYGWRAGAVQVRLSVDRKMGWPAIGQLHFEKVNREHPKFSQMNMYYYLPEKKPVLELWHGMQHDVIKTREANEYQGAFKKWPDGKGYFMEYFIPWQLLNASDDKPRAGDTLAVNWMVHWGDKNGKLWKGRIIEVVSNVMEEPFRDAEVWGKAVYK